MTIEKENKIIPLSSKELAKLYSISITSFYSWIKPIRNELGKQLGQRWTIKQIKIMYKHFDKPE
jgi:hypothetical protein